MHVKYRDPLDSYRAVEVQLTSLSASDWVAAMQVKVQNTRFRGLSAPSVPPGQFFRVTTDLILSLYIGFCLFVNFTSVYNSVLIVSGFFP